MIVPEVTGHVKRRETTLRQDRYICSIHLRNRFVNASQAARQTHGRNNNRISAQTVRNRLCQVGLRAPRPLKGPIITQRHMVARLQWTRVRIRWNRLTWRHVLFPNESKFNLKFSDGRARVYRRRNELFSDACVQETDRFGGGGIIKSDKDGQTMKNTTKNVKIVDNDVQDKTTKSQQSMDKFVKTPSGHIRPDPRTRTPHTPPERLQDRNSHNRTHKKQNTGKT
ncbi:unnamed protein product [Mytilus coruscus]|uniref:Transposase Tc1-like domain-containing protein n=1 Tax=Mytilus coruscus TaxID=42192 RepID=A0A6J8CRR4_MYTCO|nr:unnamed protein product [Mytilus coruscus]